MRIPQEPDAIPAKRILQAATLVTAISAAFVLGAWGIDSCGPSAPPTPWATIPEEVNQLEVLRFDEESAAERGSISARKILDSYGWVDPESGVAHIPIGKAAAIYLARSKRRTP